MKKRSFSILLLLMASNFLGTCGTDDWDIIVCDHCPSSKAWSVWNLDLSNPCFETKEACEAWAATHLPQGSECMKCDK